MTGRALLVTGASSGIGRAVALRAAARGDVLTLVGRDEAALREVAERCTSRGAGGTTVRQADVGDDDAVARVVEDLVARLGRLDAVVHSAAVVAYGRFEEVPVEVFDRVVQTNLLGSANVARHVLPVLRRQRKGHLLLLGSVLGDIAAPAMTPYAVTKWAVRALGRQLHLESKDLPDVHVSVVSPGSVDTPIYDLAANYLGHPGRPPFPVTTPERVARVILDVLEHPRPRRQVGLANGLMRAGFTLLPPVYDALVGPAMKVAAMDRSVDLAHWPGAVLESAGHGLRGQYPGSLTTLGRNVLSLVRGGGR